MSLFTVEVSFGQERKPPKQTTETANFDACGTNFDPYINLFKDVTEILPRKIVVNRPISYQASFGRGTNWVWDIGASFWTLNPTSPTTFQALGMAIIPNNTLPMNNLDFGSVHGGVSVFDGLGLITEDVTGNPFLVEVFFEKDAMNVHDNSVPNWYYFWEQEFRPNPINYVEFDYNQNKYIIQNSIPLNMIYSNTGTFAIGGSTFAAMSKGNITAPRNVLNPSGEKIIPSIFPEITMGAKSGTRNDVTMSIGIACFHEILEHEKHHLEIFLMLWPGGYSSLLDIDGDFYPDNWEMTNPMAIMYGFTVGTSAANNDTYDSAHPTRAGYLFEESLCRAKEVATQADPNSMIDI